MRRILLHGRPKRDRAGSELGRIVEVAEDSFNNRFKQNSPTRRRS
jgi:hypothetical protein